MVQGSVSACLISVRAGCGGVNLQPQIWKGRDGEVPGVHWLLGYLVSSRPMRACLRKEGR